jgi:hypothetical protein
MGCFRDGVEVMYRTEAACFGRAHRGALAASLVAFGYYVPLCIMVAPVLAEANKAASHGCVSTAKPYTMISNALKVVAILMTMLSSMRVWPSAAAGLGLSVALGGLSVGWAAVTGLKGPSTARRLNANRVVMLCGAAACSVLTLIAAGVPTMSSSTGVEGGLVAILVLCTVTACNVVSPLFVRVLVGRV